MNWKSQRRQFYTTLATRPALAAAAPFERFGQGMNQLLNAKKDGAQA